MNLVGDTVHNLLDGLIIGASYLASIPLGVATTLAVFFHEIPQEMGDFAVLLHGGFKRKKALLMNFLTALSAIIGVVIVFLLGDFSWLKEFLIPFAAGGFIYIAGSDLIPELHRCEREKNILLQLFMFVLGILVMVVLLRLG
jgi:zinc and cadmium transporter